MCIFASSAWHRINLKRKRNFCLIGQRQLSTAHIKRFFATWKILCYSEKKLFCFRHERSNVVRIANICLVPPEQYYLRERSFIKIGTRTKREWSCGQKKERNAIFELVSRFSNLSKFFSKLDFIRLLKWSKKMKILCYHDFYLIWIYIWRLSF